MKITDLKIGQFATRNWYNNKESLCVKRYNLNKYEYWEDGRFLSTAKESSSIFNYNDFKLCDCNGKLIEEFTYPLFMESIGDNSVTDRVVKFVSLTEGTVIIQGNSITLPSHRSTSWINHMSTKHWKPCDFFKAPEIDDLDYWDARFNAGLPVYYTNKEGISNIIIAQKPSDYVKYQVKDTYKFYISDESKQEFTYPMYFECKTGYTNTGMVIKFTSLNSGIVVREPKNGNYKTGYESNNWISSHTENNIWKQVNFDEKLNKIIPTTDDINELISDLKSIIEDDDNRFSPSEYGTGTQLRDSAYDQCKDLIDKWLEKYHITKEPDIYNEREFKYIDDLYDVIEYIKSLLNKEDTKPIEIKGNMTTQEKREKFVEILFGQNTLNEYVQNVEPGCYSDSTSGVSIVQRERIKSKVNSDDALDTFSYANHVWKHLQQDTGATENVVKTNYNKTKEFSMNNELKDAILELIATNEKPKVKKPKTPKIVCNVEGTLMEFADEAALKSFMWSSRVESVIRYDLAGKVTVPFELSVEAPKTKASK